MAGPLPLNALNAFVVSARHGSFSKAADELNVTPAAVSQQVRQLEELLDTQLFHRLKKGLTLTESGQAGLGKLQEGFQNIQEAVDLLRGGSQRSELNIWMAPSFASKWLMPRIHRFIDQHPTIDLRFSVDRSVIDSDSTAPSLSAENLQANNIDMAIRFGSGHYPGCSVDFLMDVDAIPLCSPMLLEAGAVPPLKEPKDLLKHTLLHDETPYEGRPQWESWFEAVGMSGVTADRNLYFNSASLALSAAVEGQGVVLTLEQLAQDDVDKGLLVPLFDFPMEVDLAYRIVSLEGAEEDARVLALKQWLFSEVAQLPETRL
ncbi:MAG: transcriptional regulator GcvA [Gammaproteobacteria bacterium]|nr:transcriptional regulator GcvA [Gammaproteobacteria bacterium]